MSSVKPAVYATQFHAALDLCQSVVYFHLQPREKVLERVAKGGQRTVTPPVQEGLGSFLDRVIPELSFTGMRAGMQTRPRAGVTPGRGPDTRGGLLESKRARHEEERPSGDQEGGGGVRRGPQDDFIRLSKPVWGKFQKPHR